MHAILYIIALSICTDIFSAASSGRAETPETFGTFDVVQRKSKVSAPRRRWTNNLSIDQAVAWHVGSDDYGICAHHTITEITDPLTKKTGKTDNFGLAIVPNQTGGKMTTVTFDAFRELVKARYPSFEIKQNRTLTINNSSTTTAPKYASAKRFLFLCSDATRTFTINNLLNQQKPKLLTIAAAANFLRRSMPSTTFILFDIADYCETVLNEFDTDHIEYEPFSERRHSR